MIEIGSTNSPSEKAGFTNPEASEQLSLHEFPSAGSSRNKWPSRGDKMQRPFIEAAAKQLHVARVG